MASKKSPKGSKATAATEKSSSTQTPKRATFNRLPEEHQDKKLSLFTRLYWTYYINLPFYIMTTGEAFVLHTIVFFFFLLIVYGIGVYLPTYTLTLSSRVYYYITGDNLKLVLREKFPVVAKNYFQYIDFPWLNVTQYVQNLLN